MTKLPPTLLSLLALFAVALMACGPSAETSAGASPPVAAQAGTPAPPTPDPTQEPPLDPNVPWPTKPPYTPPAPEPTKTPAFTPTPEPTYAPPPPHPDGIEGCKKYGLFAMTNEGEYHLWCMEQAIQEAEENCSHLPTLPTGTDPQYDSILQETRAISDAQHACGKQSMSEYASLYIREGPTQCYPITNTDEQRKCVEQTGDMRKVEMALFDGWAKVRIGGDSDPAVVAAYKDTITCLEELGHKNMDLDLLFDWQRFDHPLRHKAREESLTQEQKDFRDELFEPSRDCAKQNGLFEAQEVAWAAELRRLDKTEPETVEVIMREGLLEALEKPGTYEAFANEAP